LLLTFGLAMVAEQGMRIVFGAAPLPYAIPDLLRGQFFVGDFILSRYRVAILGLVVLLVGATWFLLQRTPFGRVVRAGVQNPDMVGALGISLEPYMAAVAMLGVGLAAVAGVLLAPLAGVHPAMGAEILTGAFVVVVIGGLGSFWGVVLAAFIVGVVRGLVVHFFAPAAEPSIYALMALILLIRPRGLLGERIERFE
jgi:branched-chain amino acid transport system permease protein